MLKGWAEMQKKLGPSPEELQWLEETERNLAMEPKPEPPNRQRVLHELHKAHTQVADIDLRIKDVNARYDPGELRNLEMLRDTTTARYLSLGWMAETMEQAPVTGRLKSPENRTIWSEVNACRDIIETPYREHQLSRAYAEAAETALLWALHGNENDSPVSGGENNRERARLPHL